MEDFELFLVYETWWSQGAEGTLGEPKNIGMAKTVYERDNCVADDHRLNYNNYNYTETRLYALVVYPLI